MLQYDGTPERISIKALKMLDNLEYYENQLQLVRRFLGTRGASERTAKVSRSMINTRF